jgi:hypothetical protein
MRYALDIHCYVSDRFIFLQIAGENIMSDQNPDPGSSHQQTARQEVPQPGISSEKPDSPEKETWLARWHNGWLAKQKSIGKGKTLMYWIGYLAGSFVRHLWGTRSGNAYTVPDYGNPKRGDDDPSGGGKGAASPPPKGQQVTGITADPFHAAEIISSAGASARTQAEQQEPQQRSSLEAKKGKLGAVTVEVQTACLKGVESTSLYVAAKLKALAGFVQAKLKPRTEQRSEF